MNYVFKNLKIRSLIVTRYWYQYLLLFKQIKFLIEKKEKKRKEEKVVDSVAAGLATSSSNRSAGGNGGSNQQEEEDVDLVVDGDDAAEFGPAQYSEADVVAPRIDGTPREQKERDALREAVISPNAANTPHTPEQQVGQGLVEVKPEPGTGTPLGQNEQEESVSTSPRRDGDTPVIEALRGRIRELEAEMRGQPFKCLICMVSMVSILCRRLVN